MDFIPNKEEGPSLDVPFFGEARAEEGWQGQGTTRSYETLKTDLTRAMLRLGGVIHGIVRGTYTINGLSRPGVRVNYSLEGPTGKMIYGRMDFAALPVQEPARRRSDWGRTLRRREEESIRMALYNVIQGLRAQWVLKQLNPSYVPLMPWLLADDQQTISEKYLSAGFGRALPAPAGEEGIIEGSFQVKDEDGRPTVRKRRTRR